jgi:hypothetical protein
MTQRTKLEVALTYASWGWKVLPVVPNGKIPATEHGVHDATNDPDKIKAWFTSNPRLNIGIAAGKASGIVVYDIDPRNGGQDSWDEWTAKNGQLPDGITALTAGGGFHYLAAYQEGIKSCKLLDGVDLLSNGRYFVAYPSEIEGKSYQWEASSDPFDGVGPVSIPPAWLASMLPAPKERSITPESSIIKGNRNSGLTSLAGAMRSYGMSEAEILAALSVANETRCEIPLPSSEIRQIAHSVSRYEPNSDIASSTALGAEAADELLENLAAQPGDYFLTRASSCIDEPSPTKWIIKEWLAAHCVAMIFGPSGAGKSFIALDMACSIASGIPWQGIKTKPGVVVYLAGEGNYGIRKRIASWAIEHQTRQLDNLLISNRAIDLDAPGAAAEVIKVVRSITQEPISLLIVDTVNNHMSGDENAAKDVRAMVNSCSTASSALGATTVFIHHTGVSETAQGRERGSSAWRGGLDFSIYVSRTTDKAIKIEAKKVKDDKEPDPIYGSLKPVKLGWKDEDGEEITGAVFAVTEDYQVEEKRKESDYSRDIKKFISSWNAAGHETRNGQPYLSRSALIDHLMKDGLSQATANTYAQPGKKGRLINNLLLAEVIAPSDHGWLVVDPVTASSMMISIGMGQH